MPLRLSFETGALAGIHIVTASPSVRLGRDPQTNDILLTHPKVSRRHAIIEKSVRGGYSVDVLGTGPSRLNGDPIVAVPGQPTVLPLASGDRLEFGGVEIAITEAEVRLLVVSGKLSGRALALDGPIRVGRGRSCDLVIDDPGIAEEHLAIESTPLGFKCDALAKAFFNGRPLDTRILAHGDEIAIGGTTLRFTVGLPGEIADPEGQNAASASVSMPAVKNAVGELVFIAGNAKGERIPLGDDQIILGTRGDCTFVISDLLASPLHCAISKEAEQFVATDLGSETGVFINGTRISSGTALAPGDLLAVGGQVLEARMLGGVKQDRKATTIFSTLKQLGMGPQPRFVVDGRVVPGKKLTIGRAPTCDLIVDDNAISREHCILEWENGFVARDTSSHGTYLDDKRIVKHALPSAGVLRIGNTLFRIDVRGEVCTLERADAALAQAAVEVARAHADALVKQVRPATTSFKPGDMKTMIRMLDMGELEAEIAARKKDLRRGAPAWRPSSDLAPNRALRGVIVLSLVAAIALCGGVALFGRGGALVNHPLSSSHSSMAFAAQSKSASTCASCHAAGARVDVDRCMGCHTGFTARAKHHEQSCGSCHVEHQGDDPKHALHASDTCAQCHKAQHATEFAVVIAETLPAPRLAGPLARVGAKLDDKQLAALHGAHSLVKGHGIGCNACHANAKEPGLSCMRCHDQASKNDCNACHGGEHPAPLKRLPPNDPELASTMKSPTPFASLGWALGLAFVGGAPGIAFGTWLRVRRRRSTSKLVEELKAHPAEVVKRLVHSINDSKCVGCSLCVQACPASVLELVDHKSRVVNFDSCIQCKRCEKACAFDALRMHDADKPPPMIPMPSIDAFHETPVAGMYLIGQVSGTPQVKNATNLGRAAIQRIVQQGARGGMGKAAGCDVDIAIVGSGPAGLSAALTCIELGLTYCVLEKERATSWTIRNYYHKGKEVMAEPHDVDLEATLPHWDSSREELLGAWDELVAQYKVDVRFQHNVLDIKKTGETFAVALGDPKGAPMGQLTAAKVVIAIGTLGNPRKLGCPGEELEKVKNSLVDPDEWRGKSILVVGGSDSAVEVVLALCKPELSNKVWFSTRGAKLEGIKPKNLKLIEDALAAGKFQICYATSVADVTATGCTLAYKEDDRREALPNDVIFAMIGGNSPQKWLQQIGVPYVDKPHSWSPPRTDLLSKKTAEGLLHVQRLARRDVPKRKAH